jgi:hypothetical protein
MMHAPAVCRSMINHQLQASMLTRVGDVLIMMCTRRCLILGITRSNISLLIYLKLDLLCRRLRHEKSDVYVIEKKLCTK